MSPRRQKLLRVIHRVLETALHIERRFEPWFRQPLNRLLREPIARLLQFLINRQRPNQQLTLAEERIQADETADLDVIIDLMADQMRGHFKPGAYERGGNTKTHGLVKASVRVLDNLPERFRHGVFAEHVRYDAWIRFSGPGPDIPEDIKDVGFGSMAIKLMGVEGEKLTQEERYTQDLICVSTPTFVTPTVHENTKLQYWSLLDLPLVYFLNPRDSHILDFLMQALWNETLYNPLATRYWSCVPYLLGQGQAMMYSFAPKTSVTTSIPGLPFGTPSPNYLRDNLRRTLDHGGAEFDLLVQIQTDAHRMPIEHAGVRWPERLSPFIPVASIQIPAQSFDTQARAALSRLLKFNPWHALPAHRPLGNQSRARRRMYQALSDFRQQMNAVTHHEPSTDDPYWHT